MIEDGVVFIHNVSKYESDGACKKYEKRYNKKIVIGEPGKTTECTEKELSDVGLVGLYAHMLEDVTNVAGEYDTSTSKLEDVIRNVLSEFNISWDRTTIHILANRIREHLYKNI